MEKLNPNDVIKYVEEHIGSFHEKRISNLKTLKFANILKRKNPYLFRAKNILTSQDLIKTIVDAHLSSQEETIFGEFLERLAIFINQKVYGGFKSSAKGIDLEFEDEGRRFIVSIKSGPNWGNSRQIAQMKTDFKATIKTLRTNTPHKQIIPVNGCCYGRTVNPDKGDYFKYCGKEFWEFVSGIPELYKEIIEPLGHKAKLKNEEFYKEYSALINDFSLKFGLNFCNDGIIDWNRLLEFNSSAESKIRLKNL